MVGPLSEKSGDPSDLPVRSRAGLIGPIAVAVLTLAVFWPAMGADFVLWDDYYDLVHNERLHGLGWSNIAWMFGEFFNGNYKPLAWLAKAIEYQIGGGAAAAFHIASVLLHAINATLVFLITRRLFAKAAATDEANRPGIEIELSAGLAAMLFAVHPTRVEVVDWASAQGHALGSMFFLLSVWSYLRFAARVERGGANGFPLASWVLYTASLFSMGTALAAPFALLLLDVWPLGRWRMGNRRRVVVEKLAFFAPAIVMGTVAAVARTEKYTPISLADFGVWERIAQASYSTVFHLVKFVVPSGLMPFYQDLHEFDAGSAPFVGSFILLLAFTAALFVVRKRIPALVVGWLFFLVMLAPFMGLTARPHYPLDRHTYLALLGVSTLIGAVVFALARSARGAERPGRGFISVCALVGAAVVVLAALTARQHRVWNNSIALYEHILRLMPEDSPRRWEIVGQYAAALNLAERPDEAIERYREAIGLNARDSEAHLALGMVLAGQDRWAEARDAYERATVEAPANPSAQLNLGRAFAQTGDRIRAAACFRRVIDLTPGWPDGYVALADVMMGGSQFANALETLNRGTAECTEDLALLRRLAWLRAASPQGEFRDGAEAVRLAVQLDVRSGGRSPEALDVLAAAYAEQGRFEDAIRTAERGISLARDADLDMLAADISARLQEYRTGQAYRGMPPIATVKPPD